MQHWFGFNDGDQIDLSLIAAYPVTVITTISDYLLAAEIAE